MGAQETRTRLALLALALGGFGIGCSEFISMGLLPNLASDLLPALYAVSPEEANAQAGWLITAYAVGVMVGAPTIAVMATRMPRRRALLWMLAVFVLGSIATAAAPNFGFAVAARTVAGIPHGAYFGLASLVAMTLMEPGRRGRGIAFVMTGLAVSNVIGVPALTWLGQTSGWRAAFLAVAVVFAAAFAAMRLLVPYQPGHTNSSRWDQLQTFRLPQLWIVLMIGAIGSAGLFAVFTYVAPIATDIAGLGEELVPGVLVVSGVGMVLGTTLSGRLGDWGVKRALYIFFGCLFVSMIAMFFTAHTPLGFITTFFLVSAAGVALGPVIQMRLMEIARDSHALVAALNHSALNFSNALGAALGSLVIAAGLGYLSPVVVAVALILIGFGFAVLSFRLEGRTR